MKTQGPFEGSRCLVGLGGRRWRPATIRRIYADGSFKIEFDDEPSKLDPYWYGVTQGEISFDDADKWLRVFERLSPNRKTLTRADVQTALVNLGYAVADEQVFEELWSQVCQKLFTGESTAIDSLVLDLDSAYALFLEMGISAQECAESFNPDGPPQYVTQYINNIRMGGREPSEVGRPVTLEDA